MTRLSAKNIDSIIDGIPARLEGVEPYDREVNELVSVVEDIAVVQFAIRSQKTTRSPEELRSFWEKLGVGLSRKPFVVGRFVSYSNRFGIFEPDDWGLLSRFRSAIEILRERYPDTFERGMCPSDWEELEEMDDEFRKLAPDQEPYSPVAIPEGVPESHWWWYLPRQLRQERERAATNDEGPTLA